MQKEERLGKTVPAPTKNAIPLVTDVTVMETPYMDETRHPVLLIYCIEGNFGEPQAKLQLEKYTLVSLSPPL